jgi:hypothetical protein
MKKVILLSFALVLGSKWASAQTTADGENDLKNFRFGLKATGMIDWYKPDNKKNFSSGGTVVKGSYGLITEFRLNKVASFCTGVQVDYDGGKINFLTTADNNYYWLNKDGELLKIGDSANATTNIKYKINSRVYKSSYVTIPISLKLKTPEIGAMTYFGQFGVNASFRLKTRVNDDVNAAIGGAHSSQPDLINTTDMNLFRFALNIGGGAEWNLAGSTSLLFSLNWYNGFSNVFKSNSDYMFRYNAGVAEATKQKATSNGIALTFGVLF